MAKTTKWLNALVELKVSPVSPLGSLLYSTVERKILTGDLKDLNPEPCPSKQYRTMSFRTVQNHVLPSITAQKDMILG